MAAAHRVLAVVVVFAVLGGVLWSAHGWLARGAVRPALLALTVGVSALLGVQAVLGVVLATGGARPADVLTHFVVGPLALLVLPVGRRVSSRLGSRAAAGALTLCWLLLLVLVLRAVGSGGGLSA